MNKLTRTITFGATAAAFFTLMYAVFAVNESLVQEAVALAAVIPLAAYTCLFGPRAGILSGIAALGLSVFLVQQYLLVIYAVPAAVTGVTLGILALRAKPLVTLGVVSGLMFLQLFYELLAAKVFFGINGITEYVRFIDRVTGFFADGSVAARLAHDVALCGIPAVFALSAMAKTLVYGVMLFMLMNRVFKKQIKLDTPKFRLNEAVLARIFIASEIICCTLIALTLTQIIEYSIITAIFTVVEFAVCYVYLLYEVRLLDLKRKLKPPFSFITGFVVVIFFPVTDNYFAIKALVGHRKNPPEHE